MRFFLLKFIVFSCLFFAAFSPAPNIIPSKKIKDTSPITSSETLHTQLLWETVVDSTNVFSSPRTIDLNHDGVLDIVIGGGLENHYRTQSISALDGKTGELLWKVAARNQIFGSALFMDITQDRIPDVFIGGRDAQFLAINGQNGQVIWEFYPTDNNKKSPKEVGLYNFYNPQFIPDQNNDSIPELLVANGGDRTAASFDTLRPAGHLMVISGLDGEQLAKAVVKDRHETYMSPLIHDFEGNGQLDIIYGTGGETIDGKLWRVPLAHLLNNDLSKSVAIAKGEGKGFIGPPCLADVSNDGILDVIVTSYGGCISAINGKDNQPLWEVNVPKTESYATPAIGQFTADTIPDVLSIHAVGIAPVFSQYLIILIDGAKGTISFQDTLTHWALISPIAFDSNQDGWDEVLVYANGGKAPFQHELLLYNFKSETKESITQGLGTNLAATPYIGDIDQDQFLDLIYTHSNNPNKMISSDGFVIKRIELNMPAPPAIIWGAYMGTNYDGIYKMGSE